MTIYKKGSLPSILLIDRKSIRKIDNDLIRYLNEQDQNLDSIFKNGISFSENIDGEFITFTSDAVPATEEKIAHTLGRIPIGYIVVRKDAAAHLYDSTTAFDTSMLYLKSDTGSTTFTIFVF